MLDCFFVAQKPVPTYFAKLFHFIFLKMLTIFVLNSS